MTKDEMVASLRHMADVIEGFPNGGWDAKCEKEYPGLRGWLSLMLARGRMEANAKRLRSRLRASYRANYVETHERV